PGFRETLPQQGLEIATRAVGRPRITLGRRLAKNKYPARARCLLRRHQDRRRAARQPRWKEPQTELVIIHQVILAADAGALEKTSGIAVAGQAQTQFQAAQQQQWDHQQGDEPEGPKSARREGLLSRGILTHV